MRAHLYRTLQSITGALVTGATVTVFDPGTTTPISQTLYADATSSTTLSNPFQATSGLIDFYLTNPQDVDLRIVYGAASLLAERQPVLPPASTFFAAASPVTLTNAPSPGYVLVGADSAHATWVDAGTLVTGTMNTPMPIPSTPTVYIRNGLGFVHWDGLDNIGNPMPVGFSYAVLSEVGDSPRDLVAFLHAGALIPDVTAGTSLRLVAVNQAGIAGPPSTLASYLPPTAVVSNGLPRNTVGAAGAAAALPSAPVHYLPIIGSDGVSYQIPLYATG